MTGRKSFQIEGGGIVVEIIEYGARVTRCLVPDAFGATVDVVPGLESDDDYRQRGGTMGAVVGRYANRISGGTIAIGDQTYQLSQNDHPHTMHGGAENFSNSVWCGEYTSGNSVRLRLTSPDGDQGWPGNVQSCVDYRLNDAGELSIDMSATSDQDTYLNMLFHGYWNLGGHSEETVLGHWLKIAADFYLPKSPQGIPTGEIATVADTPFDFTRGKLIGTDFNRLKGGYGHNLCLRNFQPGKLVPALLLVDPESGRAFTLHTDQPGLQLYTANQWSEIAGKAGALYKAHAAVALESQLYPNSPNTPTFNPVPVRAGEVYRHRMVFSFHALQPDEFASVFSTPL